MVFRAVVSLEHLRQAFRGFFCESCLFVLLMPEKLYLDDLISLCCDGLSRRCFL